MALEFLPLLVNEPYSCITNGVARMFVVRGKNQNFVALFMEFLVILDDILGKYLVYDTSHKKIPKNL